MASRLQINYCKLVNPPCCLTSFVVGLSIGKTTKTGCDVVSTSINRYDFGIDLRIVSVGITDGIFKHFNRFLGVVHIPILTV